MRTTVIVASILLSFFVSVSSVYAETCPTGTQPSSEDGKYYYQSVECTPQTTSDSLGSPGGTVPGSFGQPPASSNGKNITLINPLKSGTSIESFLNNILAYVIRIGTIVVILMIVYVGYLFVIAQGKPGEIEKARSALLWTVVGALILLGSQAIAISIKATVTSLGG